MAPVITDQSKALKILSNDFMLNGDQIEESFFHDGRIRLTPHGIDINHGWLVSTQDAKLSSIPVKFNTVDGFRINDKHIQSLDGAPTELKSIFYATNTGLKNLIGGPTNVGKYYNVSQNFLESLDGLPKSCMSLMIDYCKIPMLKILSIQFSEIPADFNHDGDMPVVIYNDKSSINRQLSDIFSEYAVDIQLDLLTHKQGLWYCQRALVDNNFDEIAQW
jgi:hypothetical protein